MQLPKPRPESALRIGEVARQADVSVDAVRFYEREGLLGRVRRASSGQRLYDDETVRRLAFVRRATVLGFSLAEVKRLLSLRVSARMSCERVRERALAKKQDIERRIAELEAIRDALGRMAQSCERGGTMGTCPILDELSKPLDPDASYCENDQ